MTVAGAGNTAEDTRANLLVVAERLFLADDYDSVSVRAICAAAGANPAAVHYHFGSKDELTVALLEDRLAPLWDRPMEQIEPSRTTVADVVEIILAPLVEISADPVGHLHVRLLARFVLRQREMRWTRPWFHLDRWSSLLHSIDPSVDESSGRRRWAMSFELILATFGGPHPPSPDAVRALAGYVVSGLSGPPT